VNNNPQPYPQVIHNPQVIHRYLSTSYPQAVDKKIEPTRFPQVIHRLTIVIKNTVKIHRISTGYAHVIHNVMHRLLISCELLLT
jgi:hypothetical protein